MQEEWSGVEFGTTAYRDTGVSILAALDDIQTMLDDQIIKTQTMRGSPFIKPFEEETKVSLFFNTKIYWILVLLSLNVYFYRLGRNVCFWYKIC